MVLTRICNMDDLSELYDTVTLADKASLFAGKSAYKKLVGPDLRITLQNILSNERAYFFISIMDDGSIGAYALCGVRPSAVDGPKDNANCLFIDEMFVSDAALIQRAEVELHNCIGKFADEHG